MAFTAALYIITQSLVDQYDDYPLDSEAAAAVGRFLDPSQVADDDTVWLVGSLTPRAFLQDIDPDNQWTETNDPLWTKILARVNKQLAKPTGVYWGADQPLRNTAVYII